MTRAGQPSQLEVVLAEGCDLRCSYCFADLSGSRRLSRPALARGLDAFLDVDRGSRRSVTFTVLEPFLDPDLWRFAVSHALERGARAGVEVTIAATTNALRLDAGLAAFIESCGPAVTINASVDGPAAAHERRRGGSLAEVLRNVDRLSRERVRAMCTVDVADAEQAGERVLFLAREGFSRIDVFPDAFGAWDARATLALSNSMRGALAALASGRAPSLRLLNRLFGLTHLDKALLGPDGSFYLYEWVSMLRPDRREAYRVDAAGGGIDAAARVRLLDGLLAAVRRRCGAPARTRLEGVCRAATPLVLRCERTRAPFAQAFARFARVYAAWIGLAASVPRAMADPLDERKLQPLRSQLA